MERRTLMAARLAIFVLAAVACEHTPLPDPKLTAEAKVFRVICGTDGLQRQLAEGRPKSVFYCAVAFSLSVLGTGTVSLDVRRQRLTAPGVEILSWVKGTRDHGAVMDQSLSAPAELGGSIWFLVPRGVHPRSLLLRADPLVAMRVPLGECWWSPLRLGATGGSCHSGPTERTT